MFVKARGGERGASIRLSDFGVEGFGVEGFASTSKVHDQEHKAAERSCCNGTSGSGSGVRWADGGSDEVRDCVSVERVLANPELSWKAKG